MKNVSEKQVAAKHQAAEAKSPPHLKQGEEIINIMRKGTEFAHQLLKENEKMRYQLAQMKEQIEALKKTSVEGAGGFEVEKLKASLKSLEEEKSKLVERFKVVEKENLDFANKYVEIEHENNMLANLYIASYQLHSTLHLGEVLTIIMEIIINLIGAEEFSLCLLDEKTHVLKAVASEGLEKEKVPDVKVGEGIIGGVVKSGKEYFREDVSPTGDLLDPLVCIPMKIKERVIGTIIIYRLLQQKDSFSDLDYEMFSMLAGHTATAIFSSKLYTESERKLSTIQGFIDLLTMK